MMKNLVVNMKEPSLIPELNCTDINISLKFYIEVLGFKIIYDRPENYFAMIERQGSWLMLEQIDIRNRLWLKAKIERPFGRGVNFQIRASNVEELYKNSCDTESDIFLPMEERWYRTDEKEVGNKQFIVCNPDGYLLRFFKDLGERPIQKISD